MRSASEIHRRHARHYAKETEKIGDRYLQGGEHVGNALTQFDLDRGQIDAAWMWVLAGDHKPQLDELRVAFAIGSNGIAALRYRISVELIPRLEKGLEAAQRGTDRRNEALICRNLGVSFRQIGEASAAVQMHERELELWRELGNKQSEAIALTHLGYAYLNLGQIMKVQELVTQALHASSRDSDGVRTQHDSTIARAVFRFRAYISSQLGDTALDRGQYAEALEYYEEQLASIRAYDTGSDEEVNALGNVGNALDALHKPYRAAEYFQSALDLARKLGYQHREGKALFGLALCALRRRKPREAIELLEQALHFAELEGDQREQYVILNHLGEAYLALGEKQRGINHYYAAYQRASEKNDSRTKAQSGLKLGYLYEAQGDLMMASGFISDAIDYMRKENVPAAALWEKRLKRIYQRRMRIRYPKRGSPSIQCPHCKCIQGVGGLLDFSCCFCGRQLYTLQQALIILIALLLFLAIIPLPLAPSIAIWLFFAALLLLPLLVQIEVLHSIVSSIDIIRDYASQKFGQPHERGLTVAQRYISAAEQIVAPLHKEFYVPGEGPSPVEALLLKQYRASIEAAQHLFSVARCTLLSDVCINDNDRQQAAIALYGVGVTHRLLLDLDGAISCFHQACLEFERLAALDAEAVQCYQRAVDFLREISRSQDNG